MVTIENEGKARVGKGHTNFAARSVPEIMIGLMAIGTVGLKEGQ